MAIPYPIKVVFGTVLGIGTPAIYLFAKDHLVFYEVERKIINEDVAFEVENKTENNNSWTIKVKTTDSEGWNENNGYYWECTIIGSNSLPIDKEALEKKLPLSTGSLDSAKKIHKRRLISNCSWNRTESSSKKIKAQYSFPAYEDQYGWALRLFGVKKLYEVENKVINEDLSLTVGEKQTEASNNSWTIKINSSESGGNSEWNENNGYYWECVVSGPSSLSLEQTTLQNELPSASGQKDTKKQKNKENLVHACSQNRQEESDTKVKAKFTFPTISTSGNWKTYLFP